MPAFTSIDAIATGGAFAITYSTVSGNVSISRAPVSGSFTPLYSGFVNPVSGSVQIKGQLYIDVGDKLPGPLDPTLFYIYQITDATGSVQSSPVQPIGTLFLESDPFTTMFTKVMQAGIQNLAFAHQVARPTISSAFPIGNLPAMPYIVIFPEQVKQAQQKIGMSVPDVDRNGIWTISEQALHRFRISILTKNFTEMLSYRDGVIGIFKILCAQVFDPLGNNSTHNYFCEGKQQTGEAELKIPGLFRYDVVLEIYGTFNVAVIPSYGIIEHIDTTVSDQGGVEGVIDEVDLPVA